MVVLSKSLNLATRRFSCAKPTLFHFFHVSYGLSLAKNEKSQGSSSIITKKPFSDLPKIYVLQDGNCAPSLTEWDGIKRVSGNISGSNSIISSDIATASPKESNKRGRKALVRIVDEGGNKLEKLLDDCVQPITKPKRHRKTKEDLAPTILSKPRKGQDMSDTREQPRNRLAAEILENLSKFPHCILLTRVGQFYESYFDQAIEVAHLLNIKLTSRKWDGRHIPMCGFPLMHLDKHLKVIVQHNKRFVAMCEEFPRYTTLGVKEFDRRVVRVITPGTLIDEPFLNHYENNFLLAVSSVSNHIDVKPGHSPSTPVGLAWIDVSTGEFFSKLSSYESLRDELARINAREVVLCQTLETDESHPIRQALAEEGGFVSYISMPGTQPQECGATYTQLPPVTLPNVADNLIDQPNFPLNLSAFTAYEASAINLLTTFLHTNLLEYMPTLSLPNREASESRMQIDAYTIKDLEIREGIREGGTKGSLFNTVKRTTTSGGTRLLARWLCSPSTSIKEINSRQSLVAFLHARPHFQADLLAALSNVEDAGRVVQKFILGRGEPGDLMTLNMTLNSWLAIQKRIEEERMMETKERGDFNKDEWASLDILMSRMTDLRELSSRIGMALKQNDSQGQGLGLSNSINDDSSHVETSEKMELPDDIQRSTPNKWVINPDFTNQLKSLHTTLQSLLRRREKLEQELQLIYNAPSLTLRTSPGHGMHVHLARAKRDETKIKADDLFIRIAESGTTACFFYQDWSQLGNQILETGTALLTAEREAFEMLRSEVNAYSTHIRRNARVLDELDVTIAFAQLATEMHFVRPVLNNDTSYNVINGRHPTVELGLLTSGRVFTPNTVVLTPSSRLHVLTGPNMGGKSTLLRQTALIAILAQIGSFVPADHAEIGIVDKLFSRVGAKDDLFRDRSTFMCEMLETAEILRRATPRSLVIMDEVGRGTTVKDGLAIAFATVHHLVTVNQCRTLFASHFHELSDMLGHSEYSEDHRGSGIFENVAFFCTDVDQAEDGRFAYSYRVKPGVNRDSHGLKVAQLAGIPSLALAVARDASTWLKSHSYDTAALATELNNVGQQLSRPRT